jgi:hypothetical protein
MPGSALRVAPEWQLGTRFSIAVTWRQVSSGLSGISCGIGHDRSKGAHPCHAAKNLMSLMPSPISCWPVPTREPPRPSPGQALEPNGLMDDLKKALAERVLNAERDPHLAGEAPGNRRNGYRKKTVLTDTGRIELSVPRDRQASFDPQLIARYQRRFPGFDDKIISMYARGMSTRKIPGSSPGTGHLRDLYGIEVSPDLISAVTDAVLEEVAAWQARPLERVYPLIFFDALRVKIRDEGLVRNKAVHIALGVRADGSKEILGLWLEQNDGAKFWLRVMNDLKNRGVEDVLIAVVNGLKASRRQLPPSSRRRRYRPRPSLGQALHCPPAASQHRFRLLERPKAGRGCAEGHLPSDRRRSRRSRARRLRGEPVGPQIPSHRPELATRLGRGQSRSMLFPARCGGFCIRPTPSRRSIPSCAGRSGPGAISPATRRHKAPLPGLQSLRKGGEHAAARVGHGQIAVRRPVRRALHLSHGLIGSIVSGASAPS